VSAFDQYDEPAGGLERARFTELEPLAVIDIGSNSVRLVAYEGAVRSPTPLFNEKVLCGLGRSVASTGKLGAESVERALGALSRFHAINRVLGVKNVRAIATAAVREASDGRDFVSRATRAAGTDILVLTGEREAELAAMGIRMGFQEADGIAGDLGGGSLELIDISDNRSRDAATLPLGGLRLIDTSQQRLDRAQQLSDEHIARLGWLDKGAGRSFYAVGGTWRALARLHMDHTAYPLRVMQGYKIGTREAIDFCELVRKARRITDIAGAGDVPRPRREVLPYGALVLERLLRRMKPKEVVFSVFGIREGLLFSLLSEAERRKDPLIAFAESHAQLHSRSPEHAAELCAWTDALFVPPGPKETDEERRLRHAACLLSDIGWRAHPDYRGEQSLNVIAHAGLGGIDHEGRIFLALTVYFRHIGPSGGADENRDELSQRLKAVVSKRTLRRARILGAAIRAAHMLSIGRPGIIPDAPLTYDGGALTLTIPRQHQALDGERLRRRFEVLAHLLECEPEVRIGK
jgi:exopolyphosphatase / guanosine-5'-triphosphate,3'-diphosphate pyrophosphatase